MKTLHRHLLRQVIASMLLTAAVFTLVLLIGSGLRELLPLFVSQRVPLKTMAEAIGLLIPFLWVFAMPMGLLTATLLVFGRFSADQELTAARASGISLLSLTTPILILSLVLCAFSAMVNMEVAPWCRSVYVGLKTQLRSTLLSLQLPEGRVITDFPGYSIYIGKSRTNHLENVLLYQLDNETNVTLTMRAPSGRIEMDKTNEQLVLQLYNAQIVYGSGAIPMSGNPKFVFPLKPNGEAMYRPAISDMTFTELQRELRDVDQLLNPHSTGQSDSKPGQRTRLRELVNHRSDIIVQMHRQVAFSFACFAFALIGIPLGIRMHRRETNVGIAVTLGLVAVYYSLIIIGQSLTTQPVWRPYLWMWLPNFLFEVVGAFLLWRANRGI